MYYPAQRDQEEFRPRMIVWQLTGEGESSGNDASLKTHECLLILEGIARTARPIVIFTGHALTGRPDLFDIVQYGSALGLKVIVEVETAELTEDVLKKFAAFGPKTFRLHIGDVIRQGENERYEQTPAFRLLQEKVSLLKQAGFEIHLTLNVEKPDERQLAVNHDFAFRHAVHGFYCHLSFGNLENESQETSESVDRYLEAIAQVKQYSPDQMYVSPQCVKYGFRALAGDQGPDDAAEPGEIASEWRHWCLGGKTFAFISPAGIVRLCAGISAPCGDLREKGYNFKSIWEESPIFRAVREQTRSCSETRDDHVPERAVTPRKLSA
jgi:MoaA/NifB/PqqE/SkfB family radical SAM enzyme